MISFAASGMFDGYCYGPADLLRVRKDSSTMWLDLRDSAGKRAEAIYEGCVYWQLGQQQTGLHLSMVRHVDASELLTRKNPIIWKSLEKNTDQVGLLIQQWEDTGLQFYLHMGLLPELEYLVVAQNLQYREIF